MTTPGLPEKNMKKQLAALVFAAAFIALAAPVRADIYGSSLNVVLTNQTPYPVEPGSNVDIGVQLQNNGRDNAQNVYLELAAAAPFELLPGYEALKFFSKVPSLDSVKTSYRLHVNNSAITNSYELKFRLYMGDSQTAFMTKSISVNVKGQPNLVLESLSTSPSSLEPGGTAKIAATIRNAGTGSASNMQIQFNSGIEEIKPLFSKGTLYVGSIAPGEKKVVEFEASIDSSAEEKTYTISLIASYEDESNTASSKAFSIGLPVKGSVILDIVKIEPLYDRDALRVEIANKGTTSAKSIEAALKLGESTIDVNYVSELKATKKTTMDFSPLAKGGIATLAMSYVGPGLEKNQVAKEIPLSFKNGNSSDGTGTAIIVAIIVVVVGYYFWNRRRKKKKHGQ